MIRLLLWSVCILGGNTDHAGIRRPSAALAFASLLAAEPSRFLQRVMLVGRDTIRFQRRWMP